MSEAGNDVLARLAALEEAHERSKVLFQKQLEERDLEIEALSMRLRELKSDVPFTALDTVAKAYGDQLQGRDLSDHDVNQGLALKLARDASQPSNTATQLKQLRGENKNIRESITALETQLSKETTNENHRFLIASKHLKILHTQHTELRDSVRKVEAGEMSEAVKQAIDQVHGKVDELRATSRPYQDHGNDVPNQIKQLQKWDKEKTEDIWGLRDRVYGLEARLRYEEPARRTRSRQRGYPPNHPLRGPSFSPGPPAPRVSRGWSPTPPGTSGSNDW